MIKMKKKVALFVLAPIFITSSITAQEIKEGGDEDIWSMSLEDLMNVEVVTAGKKSENIGEIPASIIVITREEIETYGYNELEDLIADIPGFYSLGNAYFYGGTNFGVRGFSTSGTFSNVMIQVNGVNQMEDLTNGFSSDNITVPIQAIDRVEVVRGPMAVVYGSNAFMGIINIITNEDESEINRSQVSVSTGSLATNQIFARLSGAEGDFHYSFNAAFSESDGLDVPYGELQSNPLILASFGLDPEATTGGQYSSDNKYFNFNGTFKNFTFAINHSSRGEGLPGLVPSFDFEKGWYANMNSSDVHLAYSLPLSDKTKLEVKITNSERSYSAADIKVLVPNQFLYFAADSKAQEYELNAFFDLSEKVSLNIGFYDRYVSQIERVVDATLFGLPDDWVSISSPSNSINTFASFSQVEFKPNDKLKLVAGVRVETTNNFNVTRYGMDLTQFQWVQLSSDRTDISDLQFIPRVAGIYSPNERNFFKLIYSQSKKRPSVVDLENNFRSNGDGLNFADMTTLEANYLTTINNRVSLNSSFYYNVLTNLIVRTVELSQGTTISSSSNKGEASTLGMEVTVKADVMENLRTELSIAYQKTTDETPGSEAIDYAFSPSVLAYFKTSYKVSDRLKFGVRGRYVDEMFAEWNPETEARYGLNSPSYLALDLNARVNIYKEMYANIFASNILDEEIRFGSNQNSTWTDRGMLGYGRRVQVTLGYKF